MDRLTLASAGTTSVCLHRTTNAVQAAKEAAALDRLLSRRCVGRYDLGPLTSRWTEEHPAERCVADDVTKMIGDFQTAQLPKLSLQAVQQRQPLSPQGRRRRMALGRGEDP